MEILETLGVLAVIIPLIVIVAIAGGLWFFYIIKFRTKTATPNQALLVTGRNLGDPNNDSTVVKNAKGNYVKIVRGGVVRLKFQQFAEKINLNSFQLSIRVENIMVKGKDNVDAEATIQISVGDTNEHVLNYAEQFLGKSQQQIQNEIEEIMVTHFRAILTTLSVEEINSNRESFNNKVIEIAKDDLDGLGFKISSFGLGLLEDTDKEGGFLSNSERKRKAVMRKEAEIVQSEADRETRIKKAEDEKLAKEIENQRAIEIAESNKIKELQEAAIRKETDKAKAEAEVVYELEKATQRKQIVAEENEVEKIRREGERKLAMIKAEEEKEVALKRAEQQVAEEEKLQEKIRIEAESKANIDKVKASAEAEVEQTKAKALALAEIERATAEAKKKELEANVEAERTSKLGKAEADSILAKGTASAKAEELMAEAKLKASEIYLKELAIKTTPDVALAIAQALGAIDSVKVFQTGGSEGENLSSSMTNAMMGNVAATYDLLKETTGVDLAEIALNKSKRGQVIVNESSPVIENHIVEREKEEKVITKVESKVESSIESKPKEVLDIDFE